MKTLFSIAKMGENKRYLFQTLSGVAEWLRKETESDKFYVIDRDTIHYDINAGCLSKVLVDSARNGMVAGIHVEVKRLEGLFTFPTEYLLTTEYVGD